MRMRYIPLRKYRRQVSRSIYHKNKIIPNWLQKVCEKGNALWLLYIFDRRRHYSSLFVAIISYILSIYILSIYNKIYVVFVREEPNAWRDNLLKERDFCILSWEWFTEDLLNRISSFKLSLHASYVTAAYISFLLLSFLLTNQQSCDHLPTVCSSINKHFGMENIFSFHFDHLRNRFSSLWHPNA